MWREAGLLIVLVVCVIVIAGLAFGWIDVDDL